MMDTAALQMKIDALERELTAVTDAAALQVKFDALEREIADAEKKHMRRMEALNVRKKSLEEMKDQLKCQAANSSPPQQATAPPPPQQAPPQQAPAPPQQAPPQQAPPPPQQAPAPPQQAAGAIVPYQHVTGALQSYSDAQPQLPTLDDMNWPEGALDYLLSKFDKECLRSDHSYFAQHPYTNVFDFLKNKLSWNAARCAKPRSGFDSMLMAPSQGGLMNAVVFSKGESNMEAQTPRKDYEPESYWWPVVVKCVPGWNVLTSRWDVALIFFYCPSLAANGGRPWCVHVSRVWIISRL